MTKTETEHLDRVIELLKWADLLEKTEPSSPYVPALQAKVKELELAVLGRENAPTPEPLPSPEPPVWNGRGVLWMLALSIAAWGALFLVLSMRRFV